MSVTKGFGDRLAQQRREKAARDQRDIGQKEVAEAVGASEPSVSRWEAGIGVPRDATIQRLADYFGVTPGWLRYGDGEATDNSGVKKFRAGGLGSVVKSTKKREDKKNA